MYAIANNSLVYHLIDIQDSNTVCGQKVTELPVDPEESSGAFYSVSDLPTDKTLCDACSAMGP